MSNESVLHGMVLALPTPFTEAGAVDFGTLERMANFYVESGVDGFFLLGSFGQGPALSSEERKRVLEAVVAAVGIEFPMVAHVGTVDPYTSIDLGEHALSLGVPGIGLIGPYYYSDRPAHEIEMHFELVANTLDVPVFIYNNPEYSGYEMSPQLLANVAARTKGITGVKVAKGSLADAEAFRAGLGPDVPLFALVSNIYEGMTTGILAGAISPPMNLTPELGVAVVRAIAAGDLDRAARLQDAINRFVPVLHPLVKIYGRGAFAAGLRHLGFDAKYPRWPVTLPSQEESAALFAAMDEARAAAE